MTCRLALFLDNAEVIMKRCKFYHQSEIRGQIAINKGQEYIFISENINFEQRTIAERAPENFLLYSLYYFVATFMQSRLQTFLHQLA